MMDHGPSFGSNAPSSEDILERELVALSFTSPSGRAVGVAPAAPLCPLYVAGHSIHAIHARHAVESADWVPARIVEVDGHYIEFETAKGRFRRWSHNPVHLRRAAEIPALLPDVDVLWCERYYILKVESDGNGQLFSLGEGEVSSCKSA